MNPILATALNDPMIQAAAEFLMVNTQAFQHVDHSSQFEFKHDKRNLLFTNYALGKRIQV
jgi:hypothetical protein